MKTRTRAACLYAAVAAVPFVGIPNAAQARDLVWDWTPTAAPAEANDGTGFWELTTNSWVDLANPGVNTVWQNGDNAIFGNKPTAAGADTTGGPYNVDIAAPIIVNNITLNPVAFDKEYSISAFSGGSLTMTGNMTKEAGNGQINFIAPLSLSAGTHIVAMRDTPDNVVEFEFSNTVSGAGGITVNNGSYEAWGTLGLNTPNTYTGATNVEKGRLILTNSQALGATSQGTLISNQGTLAFYGANTFFAGDLTVAEPITIMRSQYAEAAAVDPEFGRYNGAVRSDNGNNTLTGPVTLNTPDARFEVFNGGDGTSLAVNGNITETSPSKVSKAGNGVLILNGTNTYTGGTASRDGTVAFTTDANIGGPTSKMFFDGGYFRVPAAWTTWGAHVVDVAEFAGGIDTPGAAQVFTIADNLTGTNFNKRGVGTVNLNGTNVFADNNFTDLGTVNVNGNTTARAIRIRNGTVNINSGGSYTTTGQWVSIGNDGTENGTLNVNGTGILRAGFNPTTNLPAPQDFNVSDNPNSTGTFTVKDQAQVEIYGNLFVAKNTNTNATLNLGGTAVVTHRNGNVPIGQGGAQTAVGTWNQTGGTFNTTGEFWVGNENGKGTLNMSGGELQVNNWFVVGRFNGANGTVNLSGGKITKGGGGDTEFAVNSPSVATVTVSGTGEFVANNITKVSVGNGSNATLLVKDTGKVNVNEFWIGQGGGSTGVTTVQDSGSLTTNTWTVIGRGGTGTLNLAGNGTVTKASGADNHFIIQSGGTGTFNQTGGTFTNTISQTWIAENGGAASWNMSGGVANIGLLDVGRTGSGNSATLNVSNTASLTSTDIRFGNAGTVAGTINLDGGTITAGVVRSGGGTGTKTFNFNGGTLRAGAASTTFFEGLSAANVKAGGAKFNTNTFDVTVAQPLLHDAALGATADGGLAKSGTGVLALTGANTYTGTTAVSGGTLRVNEASQAPLLTGPGGTDVQAGRVAFDYATSGTSPAATIRSILDASNDAGFATGQIRSSTMVPGRALGYVDNPATSTVTVMYTVLGDANLSGNVSLPDLNITKANIGGNNDVWATGDYNYDGNTSLADLNTVKARIGQSVPAALTAGPQALSAMAVADDGGGDSAPGVTRQAAADRVELVVDVTTGQVRLVGNDADVAEITSYEVESLSGSIDPVGWTSLADQARPGWAELLATTVGVLEDGGFTPTLVNGTGFSLGKLFNQVSGTPDLIFSFGDENFATTPATVTYVPEPAALGLLAVGAAVGLLGRRRRRTQE